jgi:RecJ-like exonuclease
MSELDKVKAAWEKFAPFSRWCDEFPIKEQKIFMHGWQARAALKEAEAENICDACGGTGNPISEKPCMCNGTGKMSVAAIYLREQLTAEREKVAKMRKALETTIDWAEYETEYDGRIYSICNSCGGQDGKHTKNCEINKFRQLTALPTEVEK